jgi:hypothetical protein
MFQPLIGHIQAIKIHKIKITITRMFLYGNTEIPVFECYKYIQGLSIRIPNNLNKSFSQITLELLGFVPFEILLSTFYVSIPVNSL